jgi:hypothetical protein
MSTVLTFGKYRGYNFKQLLDKDVPYCEYIMRSPENERIEELQKYLFLKFPKKKKQMLQLQVDKLLQEIKNL